MGASPPRRHGCLGYSDEEMLVARGLEFLIEGAERGQRLVVVGMLGSWSDRLHAALSRAVELREGQLLVLEAADVYRLGEPIDPSAQLAGYAAMIDQALADGFSGLGVVAEMGPLLAPELVEAHVAWEAAADRFMTDHPLDALCCFDASAVPAGTPEALCSVHADADPDRPWLPRVFAMSGGLGVAGELDAFGTHRLRHMLQLADPGSDELVIDLAGVSFIDHTAVMTVADFAAARRAGGATVTVEHPPRLAPVLAGMCGVSL